MSNLGTWTASTGSIYKKLSDITGITFTEGTTYLIQIQNACYVCESATQPEADSSTGFLITYPERFTYTPSGGDLYIRSLNTVNIINIAV